MTKGGGAPVSKDANFPIRCISRNGAEVRKGDKTRIGENSIIPNKFCLAYLYLCDEMFDFFLGSYQFVISRSQPDGNIFRKNAVKQQEEVQLIFLCCAS